MLIRVIAMSIWLTGLLAFVLLVGLHLGRRVCPEARLLDDVSEPMVIVAASILALAVAGLVVSASNSLGG